MCLCSACYCIKTSLHQVFLSAPSRHRISLHSWSSNDVPRRSWCSCFGCCTVTATVCSGLGEALRLPASQTGRQVSDSWWLVLCWERQAHLSSNELRETDSFFTLHLTLQQKGDLTNCLSADRMLLFLWGGRKTRSLSKAFQGALRIFLNECFGNLLLCCLCTSVCCYHTFK